MRFFERLVLFKVLFTLMILNALILFTAVYAQEGTRPSTGSNNPFEGYSCDPSKCQLPKCKCASRDPPVADPPQFLMLTFDDSIQESLMPQARGLFENRRNPNGCPARATWFTQVYYSDPILATRWYAQGNEIADHSVSHSPPDSSSFEEFEGFRAWANSLAGIPRGKIKGGRFPLLSYSVEAFNNLAKMGFEWDSSLSAAPNEKIWPYTMDSGVVTDCGGILSICGKSGLDAKGLWEVPMYTVNANTGIELMDIFNSPSLTNPMKPEDVTNAYISTFDSHYQNGRVPFGVYLHPVWIGPAIPPSIPEGSQKAKALRDFLDYAMSRPNVWMVTPSQLIEYMKNPVPASQLGSQPYMQCNPNPAPPTNICNGLGTTGLDRCFLPNGTISTCYGCPSEYPSLKNPAPFRNTNKCPVPDTCDTLWWDPIECRCLCNSPTCAWNDTSRPIQTYEEFKNISKSEDPSKNPSKSGEMGLITSLAIIVSIWAVIIA